MNKIKKHTIVSPLFIVILFLTVSCNEETSDIELPNKYSGEPEIEFYNIEHDFGTLKEGEKVECVFKFKNTGKGPLKILSVDADCGCTVPEFSYEPILPGEEGKIKAVFNSDGFRNNIYKTIDVETNTKEQYFELVLMAFIESNNSLN